MSQEQPSWESTLGAGLRPCILEVAAEGEMNLRVLPARPGVAVFEDGTGRATLIATTGDIRGMASRRLGLEPADADEHAPAGPGARRTDHRSITRRIVGFETGSALEADVLYLQLARLRMPAIHQKVSERWRAWTAHIDPAAEFPEWRRWAADGPLPESGVVIGPLADRERAGALIESVVDAFDLCRDQSLLVQAPRARACAYKEMGRCPAPCDGGEPLASYRTRVSRAARVLTGLGGAAEICRRIEADMQAAAAGMAFEEAAMHKAQLDRIKPLIGPSMIHAGDLRRWAAAIVMPARKAGQVRLLLFAGGSLGEIGAAALSDGPEALTAQAETMLKLSAESVFTGAAMEVDALAAFTRWLYSPSTRRRGELIRINESMNAQGLAAALHEAAKAARRKTEVAAPEQVLEA